MSNYSFVSKTLANATPDEGTHTLSELARIRDGALFDASTINDGVTEILHIISGDPENQSGVDARALMRIAILALETSSALIGMAECATGATPRRGSNTDGR